MLRWLRKVLFPPAPWPVPEGTIIHFDGSPIKKDITFEVDDNTWRSHPEWRERMSNLYYRDGQLYY